MRSSVWAYYLAATLMSTFNSLFEMRRRLRSCTVGAVWHPFNSLFEMPPWDPRSGATPP